MLMRLVSEPRLDRAVTDLSPGFRCWRLAAEPGPRAARAERWRLRDTGAGRGRIVRARA